MHHHRPLMLRATATIRGLMLGQPRALELSVERNPSAHESLRKIIEARIAPASDDGKLQSPMR